MTTSPPPRCATCDIPAVHAAIATPAELQQQRRTLYQLTVELLEHRPPALGTDVIDSPLARNHLGDALAGQTGFSRTRLVALSALAHEGRSADHRAPEFLVAARPEANTLLAGALNHVGAVLESQQAAAGPLRLLTEADGEQFATALGVLRDGVTLARSISTELTEDLLAHVTLVAILDPRYAGRLASASSRIFPGLVLLETPSSIDVAEGLIHEGAHQKFFDLAITHDLLNLDSVKCPPFQPPWAPASCLWPIEQTLAAWHAYSCLARFGQDAGVAEKIISVGHFSLLPMASQRCTVIGEWLLDHGEYLGDDAHTLLEGLLGRRPRMAPAIQRRCGPPMPHAVINERLEIRRCGSSDRVLVGLPAHPPQLYWISNDAAELLELLKCTPVHEIVGTFAQRWQIPQLAAADRVTTMLSDLRASGLVTQQGHSARGGNT